MRARPFITRPWREPRLLVLLLPFVLCSCSLVRDAADIQNRARNAVAEGVVVQGDGFRVRAPGPYLHLVRDQPRPGGLTFRPQEPMFDGEVYSVTPFQAPNATSLASALEQWNAAPASKGFAVTVTGESAAKFEGLPALRATVELTKRGASYLAEMLVVRRSSDYLILSAGAPHIFVSDESRRRAFVREGLDKLIRSTTIERR